ncbi:MAG: hypothetical protein A2589_02530 [Candidatus Vogelbacteria bacterium RIFOXYD1_FULL_46_19]|uniref:DUF4190 domain-containing protein n=1 Tax=Candidatus Vogelbacteria bacterium RIFOXYD1_FULL_46_19 TaxID=1802439 RepID=A0A1G2QHP8_9BACT|nr:MAG: hypothetical protein A2589_02530 [Candidatus Vogelbacteria bacterium RIFOXYD1_FULL_46_19]
MNNKLKVLSASLFTTLLIPALTFAAFNDFDDAISTITGWLNDLIPLLIGIAVIVFLWGVVKYVIAGSDSTKRKEGGALMAYGILAIFVMISVWGLVNILVDTLDLNTNIPTDLPQVPSN